MPKQTVTIDDYKQTFICLGYRFSLNLCDDTIECNGLRMDDVTHAEICARMDAEGYSSSEKVKNVYTMIAGQNRYHPIREWLASLQWDGKEHIKALSNHFVDKYNMYDVWLRKWLIGAVAKVMKGEYNFCLVLDGKQGIGKSQFAHWLASPTPRYPTYFVEESIQPDSKDSASLLISKFVWEVSELGNTVRRADVEALKAFISRRIVTIRHPYGRYAIQKPALASFIGTVNNDTGILADRTGNRRFVISHIDSIDWKYSEFLDPSQVWAEAHAAWWNGEQFALNKPEIDRLTEISSDYSIPDSIEDFLYSAYIIDRNDLDRAHWVSTADIIKKLQDTGFRGTTIQLSMGLAGILHKAGIVKDKDPIGHVQNGYFGMQERL